MSVSDGAGECVGRIGLLDAASGQQPPHHRLNLFLLRMTDADHGLLDVVGGVLGDLKARLGRGEKCNGASVAQFQRSGRVLSDKGLLDRNGRWIVFGDYFFYRPMQRQQAKPESVSSARGDDAVRHMVEPGTGNGDHTPAHAGQARIETKNANRRAQEPFVPLLFECFLGVRARLPYFDRLRMRNEGWTSP